MGQCHNLEKVTGPTEVVSEIFIVDEDCNVESLTSVCNLIAAQGRIPDG